MGEKIAKNEPDPASNPLCALVREMLAGSGNSSWELAEEISAHMRRVVRRHSHGKLRQFLDSDDYVQIVWASVFRISKKLQEIESDKELLALLTTMTKNRVIDQTRQHTRTIRRDVTRTVSLAVSPVTDHRLGKREARPSELVSVREQWDNMAQRLSPLHRSIAELRLLGHTYEEIATQLNINKRTVTRVISQMAGHLRNENPLK